MSIRRIAFLGLGIMGTNMARRLLSAGFEVRVHNRTAGKAGALLAEGAEWFDTPRQAAESADAVVSMVADDPASRALWLGHDGALAGMRAGALAIECSTLTVAWALELRAAATTDSAVFLDAPVAGSKAQSAAGELIFMVGGDAAAVERAQPVFAAMGQRVVHAGPAGSGSRLKLINNFMAGVQAASLAEAVDLMERSGMDVAKAMEVILPGSPGSPMVKTLYNRAAARDETVNFLLRLMAKDLHYAQEDGASYDLQLRTAGAALSVFENAIARGDGDRDISAVVNQFRRV